MTKTEALYSFFNSFGIIAYPSSSVPEDTVYPWLTFQNIIANAGDMAVPITVNVWYHTESEKILNDKVEEISNRIGRGGCQIPFTGGSIWIKRGTPWSTPLTDANDSGVKGRTLNLTLEYL